MCGICGFTGHTQNRETVMEAMLYALRHRGPDGKDAYYDAGKLCGTEAALGFCRLSIIDLEGGMQPIVNETGDLILVFNGEIYNYKALKEELTAKGHVFSTKSDSETILHAYEEYGEKVTDHLRGMFAFVIWDRRSGRLFAARDFFGIKPFFYMQLDGHFVFASEIKALLEYPGYHREVNLSALEQYLSFQFSVQEDTFFRGIRRLPAGCNLTWENGTVSVKRYFDPMLTPSEGKTEEEIIRELDEVMIDSVQAHMVSDVEVGAFLSGGVDSSFIAATFSGKRAFTVGFMDENSIYNEMGRAKTLASVLNLEHHTKTISRKEFWDAVPRAMYYMDEPSGDSAAVALYFVAQEAAKYVKVVTSGEGSDELFGGYTIYCEPKSLRPVTSLPGPIRRGLARLAEPLPEGTKGRGVLIRGSKDVQERFIGNANIFSTQDRRDLLLERTGALSTKEFLHDVYQRVDDLDDMHKMQYVDLNEWLPGDILLKADRMSMAHSLELRVPFLDKEVFRVAKDLPLWAKIHGSQTKYLFRKMTEKYLPEDSAEVKKLGFPVPIRIWLKEEPCYGKVLEMFTGDSAKKFFHVEKLVKLLEDHRNGVRDNCRPIWTVYAFLIWYGIYFEGRDMNAGIAF